MSEAFDAWKDYAAMANVHYLRDSGVAFDANLPQYSMLMAGFFLGYNARKKQEERSDDRISR